jgi:hypothetical protein
MKTVLSLSFIPHTLTNWIRFYRMFVASCCRGDDDCRGDQDWAGSIVVGDRTCCKRMGEHERDGVFRGGVDIAVYIIVGELEHKQMFNNN